MLRYRPEIDGLRAVAVLSVILYHAGFAVFSGGFVGVDVFFVISGYLITSILIDGMERGTYSIAQFYERRIRRIFPPLFAMFGVSLLLALCVLLPAELRAFAKSIWQATLFGSNIGFFLDSDYFARAAETKPLLHTWSLCVEEQFYLVFPLLLSAISRVKRSASKWVVSALAVGSFAASAYVVRDDPSAAFYLAHLRAWELMIGSLLALSLVPNLRQPTLRFVLSSLGLTLIGVSVFTFHPGMSFPGPSALVPTVGTFLVIYGEGTGPTWVSKVLGHRYPVAIGLISYALYLWHWPLLVLSRIANIKELSTVQTLLVLALTFVLSIASRHWLEEPIRKGQVIATRKAAFAYALGAMATMLVVSVVPLRYGLPRRLPQKVLDLAWVGNPGTELRKICIPGSEIKHRRHGIAHCDLGRASSSATFLVWGDSHAQSLAPTVDAAAKALALRGTTMTHGGCAPVLGVHLAYRRNVCGKFHNEVQTLLQESIAIDTVILHARWGAFLEPRHFSGGSRITLTDGDSIVNDAARAEPLVRRGFERTLEFLRQHHKRTIVVTSVAESDYHVPSALARSVWFGRTIDLRLDAQEDLRRQSPFRRILESLRVRFGLSVVHPHDALCDRIYCQTVRSGTPLYFDSHHVNGKAAPLLSPLLTSVMRREAR